MGNYKVTATIQAPKSAQSIRGIIENSLADFGIDVKFVKVERVGKPGRPPEKNEKVEYWLKNRTKPFGVLNFSLYLGITKSAAWKKLEGLVRAGKITKERLPDGSMEYRVRPN